jgi:dihydrolipoamide dehydrogenase
MGCTIHDIVETIHPHPTISETLGGAAEVHLGIATDLYRPKRKV